MLRRVIVKVSVVLALLALPVSSGARVDVHIGINIPAPPQLVPVPGAPVLYAPGVSTNYFFYADQYYVFNGGAWYVSAGFNGPWAILAATQIPPPLLAVPVQYYRAPPPGWRGWPRERPPHWEHYDHSHGRGRGHKDKKRW